MGEEEGEVALRSLAPPVVLRVLRYTMLYVKNIDLRELYKQKKKEAEHLNSNLEQSKPQYIKYLL